MKWGEGEAGDGIGARDALSLEPMAAHARVAALLGPSLAGCDDLRDLGLSADFPDRRVVLIVRLSGLEERPCSSCGGNISGVSLSAMGVEGILVVRLEPALGDPAPEELRFVRPGRLGRVGRESSEYVTAGMVPCPMAPLPTAEASLLLEVLVSLPIPAVLTSPSCLETLRASSRSIRSLHCNSSCLSASINAFSVSDRVAYTGNALLAL